jgi:hypothetical protein
MRREPRAARLPPLLQTIYTENGRYRNRRPPQRGEQESAEQSSVERELCGWRHSWLSSSRIFRDAPVSAPQLEGQTYRRAVTLTPQYYTFVKSINRSRQRQIALGTRKSAGTVICRGYHLLPYFQRIRTEEITVRWPSRRLPFAFSKERPADDSAAVAGKGAAEIFSRVYRNNLWGKRWGQKFCSGPGSYDEMVVGPYVESVREFLAGLPRAPDVVDLGCGDFQVGRRLRQACGGYIACDVVPELIRYNSKAFARQQVEFRCLNIIEDDLPDGEVVFLRQVLQHLSNEQIARVLPKLTRYRFVIFTEHLPGDPAFVPNLDHGFGSGIRVTRNSGVVLTSPPFNFEIASERHLCGVRYGADVIKSIAYGL